MWRQCNGGDDMWLGPSSNFEVAAFGAESETYLIPQKPQNLELPHSNPLDWTDHRTTSAQRLHHPRLRTVAWNLCDRFGPYHGCLRKGTTWPQRFVHRTSTRSPFLHHQICLTETDFRVSLEALRGLHRATMATDNHHNSNHRLSAVKTRGWEATQTDRHKAMAPRRPAVSVCLQEPPREVEAAEGLLDNCGPSRALEATHMLSAICMYFFRAIEIHASAHFS
jgi:hypothetical protein